MSWEWGVWNVNRFCRGWIAVADQNGRRRDGDAVREIHLCVFISRLLQQSFMVASTHMCRLCPLKLRIWRVLPKGTLPARRLRFCPSASFCKSVIVAGVNTYCYNIFYFVTEIKDRKKAFGADCYFEDLPLEQIAILNLRLPWSSFIRRPPPSLPFLTFLPSSICSWNSSSDSLGSFFAFVVCCFQELRDLHFHNFSV